MSVVVLALLGGLWASILLPRAVRAWRDTRPVTTVDTFEQRMSILSGAGAPAAGRQMLLPPRAAKATRQRRPNHVVARRRTVLATLVVTTANLAVAALLFGGALWGMLAVSVLATAGYVGLLAQHQARRADARRTVRRLPQASARRQRRPQVPAEQPDARSA